MQACERLTISQLPAERPEDLFMVTIGLAKGRRFSALVAEQGARQLWQAQKDGQFMASFTLSRRPGCTTSHPSRRCAGTVPRTSSVWVRSWQSPRFDLQSSL